MYKQLVSFIQEQYCTKDFIPLHAPLFGKREKELVLDTIESSFVSSVGSYVDEFERGLESFLGIPSAVAVMNGTAALHVALQVVGVEADDLVITQALTFVATCNAISYCGAAPIFVDVDRSTLGLSPTALNSWLEENAMLDEFGVCRMKKNFRRVRACLPMHTFGHPVRLDELTVTCRRWNIQLVEDAAESLGSHYKGRHTGTFGQVGITSFNGNKIITTGGGGALLTSQKIGKRAKYLTTTAKAAHPYEYYHDEVGYNYRLPNLNAALGCAQLTQLPSFLSNKRALASRYINHLPDIGFQVITEPADCQSNYWLNGIICEDQRERDELLEETNKRGVMTRPIWELMNRLPMYKNSCCGPLPNSEWLRDRVVNIPSSVLHTDI